MWGPRSIAKLVHITPITMVYDPQKTIVTGAYKPTYNWGASHCMNMSSMGYKSNFWPHMLFGKSVILSVRKGQFEYISWTKPSEIKKNWPATASAYHFHPPSARFAKTSHHPQCFEETRRRRAWVLFLTSCEVDECWEAKNGWACRKSAWPGLERNRCLGGGIHVHIYI